MNRTTDNTRRAQPGLAKRLLRGACAAFIATALAACGGGEGDASAKSDGAAAGEMVQPQLFAAQPVPADAPLKRVRGPAADLRPVAPSGAVAPLAVAADPGLLLLLVPDGMAPTDPGVTAWIDAASEVGVRLAPVSDAQFLAMGSAGAMGYAGLVLPDMIHSIGSDEIVAAVRDYTNAGGKTFLTFDFAALTLNANGVPVFPIPKSRLSDLAGVDYVLYDKLLDKTTGLGPVTAMRSTLAELLVPPGKSEAYPPADSGGAAVASADIAAKAGLRARGKRVPLLDAAGVASGQALYLAPSTDDPGGVRGFDPQQFQMLPTFSAPNRVLARPGAAPKPRSVRIDYGRAFRAAAPASATRARPAPSAARPLVASDDSDEPVESTSAPKSESDIALKASPDALHAYSGYLLGYLIYPSYQTEGVYAGTTLATSPDFGLIAGVKNYGAGKVMFVNLPLTYLKGRTDALPMHGFLGYFVRNVVDGMRLAAVPNAVPGITFNWHLDSNAAQAPMLALEKAGVFRTGGYSMHMTAGPDAVAIGDGLGFDLDRNPVAQAFLRRMDARGHAVGSHGGWIHDYYGLNANETNAASFLPFLVENRRAVDTVLGHPSRDYSAPEGNNPLWAMSWLESQGVVGAYFGGHTGLGITRQYRDGALLNPNLWVMPVTPFGNYATFEEWQDYNVPKADVIGWFHAMVDFDIAQNTSRLVYAHPPGAYDWLDVTKNFIAYANSKGSGKFKWYSIERMADFLATRGQVSWSETPLASGATQVVATHPVSLAEMVWSLPKDRYLKPTQVSGARVANGGAYWLVKARPVQALQFQVKPNPLYNPG